MSQQSEEVAVEIDRGLRAYVELAVRNGADRKTSELAFQAGSMWALQCFGVILTDKLKPKVVQAGPPIQGGS